MPGAARWTGRARNRPIVGEAAGFSGGFFMGTPTGMTDRQDDGVWRDEEKLPLSELNQAMASWDIDGQNDPTDNDAGEEQAFGHGADVPGDERPSTTGRTGPH